MARCGMIIGYARVSTDDQNLDGQLDALKAAGAEQIFADRITGTARSRPQLDRLLDQLRKDDVITVTKYDRLARSLHDLLDILAQSSGKQRPALFSDPPHTRRKLALWRYATTPSGRIPRWPTTPQQKRADRLIRQGLLARRACPTRNPPLSTPNTLIMNEGPLVGKEVSMQRLTMRRMTTVANRRRCSLHFSSENLQKSDLKLGDFRNF